MGDPRICLHHHMRGCRSVEAEHPRGRWFASPIDHAAPGWIPRTETSRRRVGRSSSRGRQD